MLYNFDYYKFRASSVWNLFSEPKLVKDKEAGNLSESCKTFLHNIFLKEKYGFEKEQPFNKYFQKGIEMEEAAIGLVNDVLYPEYFLTKNTVRKENDFVSGECDNCEIPNTVFDTKCCWDLETFHYADKDDKRYHFQLNTYGVLYGATNLMLCYCLLNTPKELLSPYEVWYDYETMLTKPERLKEHSIKVIENFEILLAEKVNKARTYLNQIKL